MVTHFGSIWAAQVTNKTTEEPHKRQAGAGSHAGKLSDVFLTPVGPSAEATGGRSRHGGADLLECSVPGSLDS